MAYTLKMFLFIALPMLCWYHSKWLTRWRIDSQFERLAVALAGPFLSLLVMNLGLIILPKQSEGVYLSLFAIPVILARPGFAQFNLPDLRKLSWSEWLFGLAILVMIGIWALLVFKKPLTEHDTMEYLALGNVFARDLQISYGATRYDSSSGFYFVGLHAFGYPLLRTLEVISSPVFGESDYYFTKTISGLYGIFLILLLFLALKREEVPLAGLAALSLGLTYGFIFTFLQFGLDDIRFCFHFLSFYFMYLALKNRSEKDALLMAVFIGFGAFIHSIGLILGVFQLIVLFLFAHVKLFEKVRNGFLQVLFVILFGSWHYVIDVLFGTGWIL